MRFTRSLSFSISLLLVVIVVGLLTILFYNNLYAMNVVRSQVVQSYRDLLPRYVERQDDNLSDIQNYLIRSLNHTANNPDIRAFSMASPGTDAYHLAATTLFQRLSRDYISYQFADILFVYTQSSKSLVSYASVRAREISSVDANLKDIVRAASATFLSSRWQITTLGGVPGLMCMSTDGEGNFMGAWVDLRMLLATEIYNPDSPGRGMILLSGDGGIHVATEDLPNLAHLVDAARIFYAKDSQSVDVPNTSLGYLLIAEQSKKCDLYFVEAIQEGTLLSELRFFQVMIYVLPVIMFIAFLLYFAYLQRILVYPVHRLTSGMAALGHGNIRVTLPESGANEIRFLIRSFNEMTTQIETLRIENYEKQLQAQQAEIETKKADLRSMQLQINPHFFANSLNIIYSLSAIRDYQTIQKMALLLSRYFRYIMHSGEGLTDVRRELSFVRDYLDIQKLRYTRRLRFEVESDPRFDDCAIPALTLQPFVENAIVHGFTDPSKPLEILVRITPASDVRETSYLIRIQDNGGGFSNAQLDTLSQEDFIETGDTRHIGIWNVLSRLKMSYGAGVAFRVKNNPEGGACVEIRIPCTKMDTNAPPVEHQPIL